MANKDENLIRKVNQVIQKIENEPNPVKRAINVLKLELLKDKMNKELDINCVKEEYAKAKETLKKDVESKKIDITKEKGNLIARKQLSSNLLAGISYYDPESEDFMYQDELDEVGEENLLNLLQQRSPEAASKYKEVLELKEDIKQTEAKMNEMKNKNKEMNEEIEALDKDEQKELVEVGQLYNPFKRFLKAVKKAFSTIAKDRENKKKLKEQYEVIDEVYAEAQAKKIEEIEDSYNSKVEKIDRKIKQREEWIAMNEAQIAKLQENISKHKQFIEQHKMEKQEIDNEEKQSIHDVKEIYKEEVSQQKEETLKASRVDDNELDELVNEYAEYKNKDDEEAR